MKHIAEDKSNHMTIMIGKVDQINSNKRSKKVKKKKRKQIIIIMKKKIKFKAIILKKRNYFLCQSLEKNHLTKLMKPKSKIQKLMIRKIKACLCQILMINKMISKIKNKILMKYFIQMIGLLLNLQIRWIIPNNKLNRNNMMTMSGIGTLIFNKIQM